MLVLLGYLVVIGSIFGGYALMGGHFGALYQPLELLMIGGSALGAFLAGNGKKTIVATVKELPRLLRGSRHTKALYMDLLALLFVLLAKGRKDGMLALEGDIEDAANSPVFQQYPSLMADHHLMDFVCDYLRVIISGSAEPMEVEALMDHEIETHHHEAMVPAQALHRVSDALPALGIVAAVLGVVHALASADQPPSVMGQLIAHAMVGTFLGVLLAYGFVSPLATVIEQKLAESSKMFETVKVTLLASMNGYAPQLAVEFGRKVLYSTERPSFAELDAHVREVKAR